MVTVSRLMLINDIPPNRRASPTHTVSRCGFSGASLMTVHYGFFVYILIVVLWGVFFSLPQHEL